MRLFLPIGLILVIGTGLLVPTPGRWLSHASFVGLSPKIVIILMIFVITGYKICDNGITLQRRFIYVVLASVAISLIGGPLVAMLVGRILGISGGFYMGLIVMGAMPTTLSSAVVITRSAGGNVLWAVMLTILLNVIGVFLFPFTIAFCINASSEIHIAIWPIFQKILFYVIVPLFAGGITHKLLGRKMHTLFDYLPSLGVILFVWMAISVQAQNLQSTSWSFIAVAGTGSLLVHLALILAATLAQLPLRLNRQDTKALIFTTSQKTLPIAMAVLMLIQGQAGKDMIGSATIICVLFHFIQVILDSFIASGMIAFEQNKVCDLKDTLTNQE